MNKKWFFTFYLGIFIFLGCNQPLSEPEQIDPIYADLVAEKTTLRLSLKNIQQQIKGIQKELVRFESRHPRTRKMRQELSQAQKQRRNIEQDLLVKEIQVQLRRDYARKSYRKAFDAGEPWPNPEEYQNYSTLQRLRQKQ